MPARYSIDQPWNFGFTPSEYFETLSPEQKSRVKLQNISLHDLDSLHELTLATPNSRKVVLEDLVNLAIISNTNMLLLPALVMSHCKPFSELDIDPLLVPQVLDLIKEHGVSGCTDPSRDRGHRVNVLTGYSAEIIAKYQEIEARYRCGKLTINEAHMMRGIIFGFPIGDVFSWTFEHDRRTNDLERLSKGRVDLPGLFFVSYALGWSEVWKAEVGEKGLRHLRDTSYQQITNFSSFENSPLQMLFRRS